MKDSRQQLLGVVQPRAVMVTVADNCRIEATETMCMCMEEREFNTHAARVASLKFFALLNSLEH